MFKIFKSKIVITNVVTLILSIVAISTELTGGIWGIIIPKNIIFILTGVSVIGTLFLNHFAPSGELLGRGQNWDVAKYIATFSLALLAFVQEQSFQSYIHLPAETLAIIIQALQLVARIFGGATSAQKVVARYKGLPTGRK